MSYSKYGLRRSFLMGVSTAINLSSGHAMPALGAGTYRLEASKAADIIYMSIGEGFRLIDCAPIYFNQREVGHGIRRALQEREQFSVRREDLFITSKIWPTDQHPDNVRRACLRTLEQLECVGYLDLLLIHWPIAWKHCEKFEEVFPKTALGFADVDSTVKLCDTWTAMEQLVAEGKVRSIGFSNCSDGHFTQLMDAKVAIMPAVNQIELHPALQQKHLRHINGLHQCTTQAYCPLGSPTRFTLPSFTGLMSHPFLGPICEHSGFSPARLLLNWSLESHNSVIVKSSTLEHIRSNAKAQKFALSEAHRWMLNHFEEQVMRIRVIDPLDFTEKKQSFFHRGALEKENAPSNI